MSVKTQELFNDCLSYFFHGQMSLYLFAIFKEERGNQFRVTSLCFLFLVKEGMLQVSVFFLGLAV